MLSKKILKLYYFIKFLCLLSDFTKKQIREITLSLLFFNFIIQSKFIHVCLYI